MSFLLILLLPLIFSAPIGRLIITHEDVKNISNTDPSVDIDANFTKAITNLLVTPTEASELSANFKTWMLATWGIDLSTATYDPVTTGYYFPNGYCFPATIIDPAKKVILDSVYPFRGISGNWFVSAVSWYVGFTNTFILPSGANAGAYIDPASALIYGNYYYVKAGANWSNPLFKEKMPCQTDVTGKFVTNMYIPGGQFGGTDDIIRYHCTDFSAYPPALCEKYEMDVYTRHPDGSVDVTTRSDITCTYPSYENDETETYTTHPDGSASC